MDRATSLKDQSILHDLCKGHARQLEVFHSNHAQMIEITNKMRKAKLELIRVVHSRLQYIFDPFFVLFCFVFDLRPNDRFCICVLS